MKKLITLISIILLGCTAATKDVNNKDVSGCFNTVKIENHKLVPVYCSEEVTKRTFEYQFFSMRVPGNVFRQTGNMNDIWLINYKNDDPNPMEVIESAIRVLPNSETLCTSPALGISALKEREAEGTKVWTGLVDAYDIEISNNYAPENVPPCKPPDLSYSADPNDYGDGMTRFGNSAAYALCSEKDGKRVVVCVQQMTDNPELAEEIFSTFRWTK